MASSTYGRAWMLGDCGCGARLTAESGKRSYCEHCNDSAEREVCFALGLPPTRENTAMVRCTSWWEGCQEAYGPGYYWLTYMDRSEEARVLDSMRRDVLESRDDGVVDLEVGWLVGTMWGSKVASWISVIGGGVVAPTLSPPAIPPPEGR